MRHPKCDIPHQHDQHPMPAAILTRGDLTGCSGDAAPDWYEDLDEKSAADEQGEIGMDIGGGGLGQVLRDWWVDLAAIEADKVVPKAIEYGSTDLREIGRTMRDCLNYTGRHTDATDAELGIYFYLVGKMARWTDAIKEGRKVSDDTLHDIGVYVRMAQRVRAVGGWPFGPMEKEEGE